MGSFGESGASTHTGWCSVSKSHLGILSYNGNKLVFFLPKIGDKKYTDLNRGIFGRCVQKISMCPVKNGIQATPVGENKNTKENQHSAR